ncbi:MULTISPECIES: glycoside hydrolase family 76 protein [Sphingobacterium]|nr:MULTISPECIES: glycoside hydrolase family 76 protein [Sphingobacterium]APU98500.1 glycosyl hydrolase family 76 [Sphingobacterium sp. B29]HAU54765.1 glycosyl hydrolase family 76 [Sphingobacterium sp.]HCX57075.1 glycosyl hydrolase family 76 [Sphingobacterium sp.]
MNKMIILSSLLFLLLGCTKIEDSYPYDDTVQESWTTIATQVSDKMIAGFWNESGYFNNAINQSDLGFQYWPNAHAMDVVIDAYLRTKDSRYSAYFSKWFEGVKIKNGNTYYNVFYDDMEWNALTILRLYEITKDQKYLDTVLLLWTDIAGAWDEQYAGGGLAWKKDMRYSKNACSNGPASILAARLYRLTKDENYLTWAKKIYEWQKATLYNPSTGAVYDNINGQTGNVDMTTLTYNQGTFLGTAVELFKITKDQLYLVDAQKISYYTITRCIDGGNNILRDEGSGDGALFKGIFIRYFVDYLNQEGIDAAYRSKFEKFLVNNGKIAWTKGTSLPTLFFGPSWAQPPIGNSEITAYASAAMLFEGLASYENKLK